MSPIAFNRDERSVSIAINHVLTIGITTALITILLLGLGGLLDSERERAASDSLQVIGERMSSEISSADRLSGGDDVTIRTSHPRTVSGSTYTAELDDDCEGPLIDDGINCVILTAHQENVEVLVPIDDDISLDDGASASGGSIVIEHDGSDVTIRGGS